MKQSAVKTLGVAALGAAFAAVGAGAANAAPAGADALGNVTGAVQAPEVPKTLPAADGVNQVLGAPQDVVDGVNKAAPLHQIRDNYESTRALTEEAQRVQRAERGEQGGKQGQQGRQQDGSLLPAADSGQVGQLIGGLPVAGGLFR